jgi:hypothetical protein
VFCEHLLHGKGKANSMERISDYQQFFTGGFISVTIDTGEETGSQKFMDVFYLGQGVVPP